MAPISQHSRSSSPASNTGVHERWKLLGAACREVADSGLASAAVERILDRALVATGAERAFVVCADGDDDLQSLRVRSSRCSRPDGVGTPSRTVLLRSLSGRRLVICADAARDSRLATGDSVRALGLRFVLSAPLTVSGPGKAALVLDSRLEPTLATRETRDLMAAFAGLLSLFLETYPEPRASPSDGARAESDWIGESPAFRALTASARRMASWPLPVLITGESGCGKEGAARLLHTESDRRMGPFVGVNCASITETLLESELFGAVRGAYTGIVRDRPGLMRLADGGTLLLDEVGDMSLALQAKLLRVLQERRVRPVGSDDEQPVDVRILAATHRDLPSRVADGRFRQDLYYRLAVFELRVPALRERREDIRVLVRHLAAKLAQRAGRHAPRFSPSALSRLRAHDWPGNIRELEAVVARAMVASDGTRVHARDVDLPSRSGAVAADDGLEARMIENALRHTDGVVSHAAADIGWSRQKLTRRMAALRIDRSED